MAGAGIVNPGTGGVQVTRLVGREIAPWLEALARLRITVFRDFPYLYAGSLDYERQYLEAYVASPGSVLVLVQDGEAVVGSSTGMPLADEAPEFRRPFEANGYDASRVFYFAESVLLPEYRGQGLGVRFFEEREAHARTLGRFDLAAFCAVERPHDHPRRPADYAPLDSFWRRRGFVRHPELRTSFAWQDLDEAAETPKPMTFWLKSLRP